MNKAEHLIWLQQKDQQFEAFLAEIGPARMELPGVNGDWSMKELISHLTGWNRRIAARFEAAQRRQPEPPPPWPAHLQDDDEINAWIYDSNRGRSLQEVLDERRQTHQQIIATMQALPDDVRIETIEPAFYLVWIDDKRYDVGEFFYHYQDDHEANVRAWLVRGKDTLSAKAKIRIRRSPSDVFNAFADASAMSKFWFTRRDDGLKEGESITWFIGSGEDTIAFDVRVKELSHPNKIVIVWERDGAYTQVTWSIEEIDVGNTILTIEESGFSGSRDVIIEQALDSTGGFNQVIIAAKALLEHGIALNVVADHA